MKIGVRVMLKPEVLDVEGRAVADTLSRDGEPVQDCRVGKYIVLDLPERDFATAKEKAIRIAKSVLANPLIESYELEELGK
jgi:phosphoribosylformylglycinamidine synthase PurS subunit